jgi:hypothetical protein
MSELEGAYENLRQKIAEDVVIFQFSRSGTVSLATTQIVIFLFYIFGLKFQTSRGRFDDHHQRSATQGKTLSRTTTPSDDHTFHTPLGQVHSQSSHFLTADPPLFDPCVLISTSRTATHFYRFFK